MINSSVELEGKLEWRIQDNGFSAKAFFPNGSGISVRLDYLGLTGSLEAPFSVAILEGNSLDYEIARDEDGNQVVYSYQTAEEVLQFVEGLDLQ